MGTIHELTLDTDDGTFDEITHPQFAFVKEEAGALGRYCSFCCPGARKTKYTVYEGTDTTGKIICVHEKGYTCPMPGFMPPHPCLRLPWCCCLPHLKTRDQHGLMLGSSLYKVRFYNFLCTVPQFRVRKYDTK